MKFVIDYLNFIRYICKPYLVLMVESKTTDLAFWDQFWYSVNRIWMLCNVTASYLVLQTLVTDSQVVKDFKWQTKINFTDDISFGV